MLNVDCLCCIVSDSAGNMNCFGTLLSHDKPTIAHHYCIDHLLHLTANKLYTGETSLVSLKLVKSLVSFINSSPQTNEKLMDIQCPSNPTKRPVKLLTDVKTCWWSVHVMVQRALCLCHSLDALFRQETIARQQSGKQTPSKLESLQLMEHHYTALTFLEKVLHPFHEAQRALEGDQYVSVLLIIIIIKTLYDALLAMHPTAATDF